MSTLNLGVIGNCTFSALVDPRGRVVWSCQPHLDSDPVFCSLLGGREPDSGFFDIEMEDFSHSDQEYRRNSAVLVTRLYDTKGRGLELVDFAPRFKQFGRVFRPSMIVRRLRPISGTPRIKVRIRPMFEYGRYTPQTTRGSNHLRFVGPSMTLRLTSDAPIAYIAGETPFNLDRPLDLILGPDESLTSGVAKIARDFEEQTDGYWLEWVRYLALPFEWQEAVIRAAITLKLSNFEESGAIIAAMTTSIPEHADSGRNWDYRFCWLRDSYFTVNALNALGATRTMEGYLRYIDNIVASAPDGYLQPVFGISQEHELIEREESALPGYRGMGPVRVGNGAYTQVQNDGYGSVVLASAHSFFDHRLKRIGDLGQFERLELMGQQAIARWNEPDAGLWELRTRQHVHTYSSLLCWAACDRLERIARHLRLEARQRHWAAAAETIRRGIHEQGWNDKLQAFTGAFGGEDMDASLLMMSSLGFIEPKDPRFLSTLSVMEQRLRHGRHMYRYANADDFGLPETAFNVCTFWYIEALASVGRSEEARELFESMLAARNSLGLMSEDIAVDSNEQWGNYPQTYSLVGLIHAAKRLSMDWEQVL